MLDQAFQVDDLIGKVARRNSALHGFEAALYTRKLYEVYSDIPGDIALLFSVEIDAVTPLQKDENPQDRVKVSTSKAFNRPDVQASLDMKGRIDEFCGVAPRITIAAGAKWHRAAKATPDQVDTMFQLWLEREDLRTGVLALIEEMDFPNGKEGASAALLTTEDLTDPLSVEAVSNGVTI